MGLGLIEHLVYINTEHKHLFWIDSQTISTGASLAALDLIGRTHGERKAKNNKYQFRTEKSRIAFGCMNY